MKRKLMLKVTSLMITFGMLLTFLGASALAADKSKGITLDMIEKYAEKWADEMYDNDAVGISEITPLYDIDNSLHSYHITYKDDLKPQGYIVLNVNDSSADTLVEYSLEGSGAIDYLNDKTEKFVPTTIESKESSMFYYLSPFVYYKKISINNQEKVLSTNGELLDYKSEFKGSKTLKSTFASNDTGGSWSSIMDFHAAPGIIAETKIISGAENFTPSTTGQLQINSGAGNCVPTCATNIAVFFDECRSGNSTLIPGTRQAAYNAIVNEIGAEHSIYHKDGLKGLKDYCAGRGYLLSYDDYWLDLWSDFTRDVNNNKPIWVSVGVGNEGHSMVCVGYVIRSVSGKKTNYLRVATGWANNIGSVAQFNGFDRLNGYGLTIKNVSG